MKLPSPAQACPAEASAPQRGQAARRVQAALHDLQADVQAPRLPLGPREAARGTSLVMAGGHDASWFCPK